MLDDLKSILGQIPNLESRVKKLEGAKPTLNIDDFVECEQCGVLVSKDKAQKIPVLESEYPKKLMSGEGLFFTFQWLLYTGSKREESRIMHLCPRCKFVCKKKTQKQSKKFKRKSSTTKK